MSYSNFNRHENMNEDTRFEILSLLKEVRYADLEDTDISFNLENMMYGLFDGYLYEEIQMYALKLDTELCSRILKVYDICNRYPKLELNQSN